MLFYDLYAPIIIICKDRISYLDLELKSLSATVPHRTWVYLSNDGTTNPQMLNYLSTTQSVPINNTWSFPTDNEEWSSLMGDLSLSQIASGIGGKTHVLLHTQCQGTQNLGLSMRLVFESTNAQYVIKMEDDLVFIQDWYYKLIKSIVNSNCDLLSGFRYFFGTVEVTPINHWVEEMIKGYTGGQLMIASRRLYHKCPAIFDNDIKTIWNNDDFWIDQCRQSGLKFGVTTESLCQHVGFSTESGQKGFVKDGMLLKIDPKVRNLVVANEVHHFGGNNALRRFH